MSERAIMILMSLVITLYVREGIVMASDSRLTLNSISQSGPNQTVNVAVAQSDTNYKTFLTPNSVGISTYGAADIGGVPIAGTSNHLSMTLLVHRVSRSTPSLLKS